VTRGARRELRHRAFDDVVRTGGVRGDKLEPGRSHEARVVLEGALAADAECDP